MPLGRRRDRDVDRRTLDGCALPGSTPVAFGGTPDRPVVPILVGVVNRCQPDGGCTVIGYRTGVLAELVPISGTASR